MAFERCKNCHEYDHLDRHKCKPEWRVYVGDHHDPADPNDGCVVHANDPSEAAESGLEDFDDAHAEGPTLEPVDVIVRRIADGMTAKYSVCGEVQVEYHARAID